MRLLGNRVLVEPEKLEMWRGIHLPEDITHFTNTFAEQRVGRVLSVGTGRMSKKGVRIPIAEINVGDRVLLPRSGTRSIEYEGRQCLLIDANELIGVLRL